MVLKRQRATAQPRQRQERLAHRHCHNPLKCLWVPNIDRVSQMARAFGVRLRMNPAMRPRLVRRLTIAMASWRFILGPRPVKKPMPFPA